MIVGERTPGGAHLSPEYRVEDRFVVSISIAQVLDPDGKTWRETRISGKEVAVEDIKVADLNGDGKIDIVAAGRQTKNLVIYFNKR